MLFQLRQYRTVLNANETKLALQRSLNATVDMQQFETISIRRQIELVTCADVLIGVSGAGLTYHRFLTPGAIMVELGWTGFPGGMHCVDAQAAKQVKCATLSSNQAKLSETSWKMYFDVNKGLKNRSRDDIVQLATPLIKPNGLGQGLRRNIWKYADCVVDIPVLITSLKTLLD